MQFARYQGFDQQNRTLLGRMNQEILLNRKPELYTRRCQRCLALHDCLIDRCWMSQGFALDVRPRIFRLHSAISYSQVNLRPTICVASRYVGNVLPIPRTVAFRSGRPRHPLQWRRCAPLPAKFAVDLDPFNLSVAERYQLIMSPTFTPYFLTMPAPSSRTYCATSLPP